MYNGSGMAVAGAGAKDARPYHYAGGTAVFFFLMSVAGLVLLPVGTGKAKTNALYNPATDFTTIVHDAATGYGCKVTKVDHVADQRQNKDPYCVDVYTYTFSYLNAGGALTLYNSSVEEHKRSGPGKCTNINSNQVPPTHAVGTTPTCYAPAVLPVSRTLFDFYGCGNEGCLKVVDPAIIWNAAKKTAKTFTTLGGVFAGVGLPFFLVLVAYAVKSYSADSEPHSDPQKGQILPEPKRTSTLV